MLYFFHKGNINVHIKEFLWTYEKNTSEEAQILPLCKSGRDATHKIHI